MTIMLLFNIHKQPVRRGMVPPRWCETLVQRLKAIDPEALVQHFKLQDLYVGTNVSTPQISKAYMLGPTCQCLKIQKLLCWDQRVSV